jgi:hypothetical protein
MPEQHINTLDQKVAELLRRRANPISRRSILGRSIKFLLGLAGVGVGISSIPLFADLPGHGQRPNKNGVPRPQGNKKGDGFDPTCNNLHGYTCDGNCAPTAPGATDCLLSDLTIKQAAWVGCCKRTDTGNYQCYKLSDYICATRPTNWGVNCPGNTPSGRIWFGGKIGKRRYVCTVHTAVGSEYATGADCALNCTPDIYPNTWAC